MKQAEIWLSMTSGQVQLWGNKVEYRDGHPNFLIIGDPLLVGKGKYALACLDLQEMTPYKYIHIVRTPPENLRDIKYLLQFLSH